MAKYYTKETLKTKVNQLETAVGSPLKILSCNGTYAVEYRGGPAFPGLGWYHSVEHCIIYIEGVLEGIKQSKL